jgi:hypothetical protein
MALLGVDGAGLMLADEHGVLRWATASDQPTQVIEEGQERLGQAAGRHLAQRRGATRLALVTIPLAVIVAAALLINWVIGSDRQGSRAADATPALPDVPAATTANAGPTSRPRDRDPSATWS